MRRRLVLLIAFAAVLSGPPAAWAQASATQQASDLAHQLMSPFCPGKLLSDCTSPNAGVLRKEMAERIAGGESPEAVKAALVRQYGAEILGAPEPEGVGLLVWVLPALLAAASAAAIGWKVVTAARETRARPVAAAASVDTATFARLDDELRELD